MTCSSYDPCSLLRIPPPCKQDVHFQNTPLSSWGVPETRMSRASRFTAPSPSKPSSSLPLSPLTCVSSLPSSGVARPRMNGSCPDPGLVFTLRGCRKTWVMCRCGSNAQTSWERGAERRDGATWCHAHLLLCAGQTGSRVTSWDSRSLRIIASVRHESFLQTMKTGDRDVLKAVMAEI